MCHHCACHHCPANDPHVPRAETGGHGRPRQDHAVIWRLTVPSLACALSPGSHVSAQTKRPAHMKPTGAGSDDSRRRMSVLYRVAIFIATAFESSLLPAPAGPVRPCGVASRACVAPATHLHSHGQHGHLHRLCSLSKASPPSHGCGDGLLHRHAACSSYSLPPSPPLLHTQQHRPFQHPLESTRTQFLHPMREAPAGAHRADVTNSLPYGSVG